MIIQEVTQKFKRGNLVKLKVGHMITQYRNGKCQEIDISPEQIGKLALIKGSYADLYGGNDKNSYSVIFLDSGSELAWKNEREMEFVDDGGEHLFKQAKENKERIIKKYTDLNYIVNNWQEVKGKASSITILYLFDKIGFTSSFNRNGEFFVLFNDWHNLLPLFDAIMNAKHQNEVLNSLSNSLIPQQLKDSIIDFYLEVQSIKS